MRTSTLLNIEAGLMEPTDTYRMPKSLTEPFPDGWPYDLGWTWVARRGREPVGVLYAGLCQNIVIVMMVRSNEKHALVPLFRAFASDCQQRGHKAYMVYLNPEKPEQLKIAKIAQKAGAIIFPQVMIGMGGSFESAVKW